MAMKSAPDFPEEAVRERARHGTPAVFPPLNSYGLTVHGARPPLALDELDSIRLLPPVFMEERLEKLIDLGREPLHSDVDLRTKIGGFSSALPIYISAFGSTTAGSSLGLDVSRQAAELGVPMVIGENIVPVQGYGRIGESSQGALLARLRAYADHVAPETGGVAVQQSTEDADAEVWNLVYSDPGAASLLDSGRLAFELKVGQGAKPGLGGMTVVSQEHADRLSTQYAVEELATGFFLRSGTPGTYTAEILRQQVNLMRNNYPRAKVWVKLHPGRDVRQAAEVAWAAGADSVTIDGAQGGTGWAPTACMDHVGLPLLSCLLRVDAGERCLLASGGIWEGSRAVKALALGARAVGLGRAAILAVDEDPEHGLVRFVDSLRLELQLLLSSLGHYRCASLTPHDLEMPASSGPGGPAMTNPFENDNADFVVLVNGQRRYSLWPADLPAPAGWQPEFGAARRAACLDYIERHFEVVPRLSQAVPEVSTA